MLCQLYRLENSLAKKVLLIWAKCHRAAQQARGIRRLFGRSTTRNCHMVLWITRQSLMLMMTWTQYKGSHGYKVESKKTDYAGNWILLPAAGYRLGGSIYYTGSYGEYWSSTLDAREPCSAYYLKFHVALIRCCRQSSAWSTLA